MKKIKIIIKALRLSIITKSKISVVVSILGFVMALLPAYIAKTLEKFTDMLQEVYYNNSVSSRTIIYTFSVLAILYILQKTYAFFQGYFTANDSINTNHYIRKKTLDYRCSVQYKYMENYESFNEKIAFVNTYTGYKVANSIQTIILWLQNLITFISVIYILANVDMKIIIIVLVTSIPASILSYIQNDETYKHNAKWMQEGEMVIHYFFLCIGEGAMEEIRHLNIYDYLKAKWRKLSDQYIEKKNRLTRKHVMFNSVADLLRNLVYIFILLIVARGIYHEGIYTLGTFILVYSLTSQLQSVTTRLIIQMTEFNSDIKYMKDFFDFEKLEFDQEDKSAGSYENTDIHFDNVSFCYPGTDKEVLKNINLHIKNGEKIAVIGKNGSGKTTFINLLCGLYMPDQGKITINQEDIRHNIPKVRNSISVVFQDFGHYDGTLCDNITISDLDKVPDEDMIMNYATKISAEGVIDEQVQGLNSNIGLLSENSNNISGGQWQKIALLRALYRDKASIMVLDEPTAALDPIAETILYRNFRDITEDKTTILISHRLGVTSVVDRILVFDDGKIIEDGTHDELMKMRGEYWSLYNAQAKLYI